MAWLPARSPHRRGQNRYPRNVIALIKAKALIARGCYLLHPLREGWRVIPAQRIEPRLDLGFRIRTERRDAAPGCADQCGEPATHLCCQLKATARLRHRNRNNVINPENLHPQHGHAVIAADPIEQRLSQRGKGIAPQPAARKGEHA